MARQGPGQNHNPNVNSGENDDFNCESENLPIETVIPNSPPDAYVEIKLGNFVACTKHFENSSNPERHQVYAFPKDRIQSLSLELAVKDKCDECEGDANLLGRISFDINELPVRVPPDSPLAAQWYRLENRSNNSLGELMVSVWMGTQADESFPMHRQFGRHFSEPFDEQLVLSVEEKNGNREEVIGKCFIPLHNVEKRMDTRAVSSKWYNLEKHIRGDNGEKKEKSFGSKKSGSRMRVRVELGKVGSIPSLRNECESARAGACEELLQETASKNGWIVVITSHRYHLQ
ncbi:FT-interacting protein 1-like protein [Tanacetum coccineum]